jgi:hypothetical protein
MASGADAEVHRFGKRFVPGALEHAGPQSLVGRLPLLFGAAAPVGDVVLKAAFTPFRPVADGPVVKEAATVTGEILQVRCPCRGAAREHGNDPQREGGMDPDRST